MKKKLIYIFLIGCLTFCQSVFSQAGGDMMRGRITSDKGEALMFVQILEVDRSDRVLGHTQTDMNGDFALAVFNTANSLKVSYLGFGTQVLPIGTRRTFNVVLRDDNTLAAVTITADRTTAIGSTNIKDSEIGFAMQKISTKDFEGIQYSSIDDALQGQIAGLDIMVSGDLGRKTSMRIRGTSSINANVDPLIVMNGIPREDIIVTDTGFDVNTANEEQFADLLSINPDDILEIVILKDASSAAAWGSRGANGVIEIKTKRGATGPTRVNYTYKFTAAKQPQGLKMLNGDDYTMMMKQALFNPRLDNNASSIREFDYDTGWTEYPYYSANTDWRKAVIRTANTHTHDLSFSGGGEKATFRITGGYMSQKGTVIGQGLDRLSSRMSLDYYVSSRIRFSSEFAFTYTNNDRSWTETGDHNGYGILELAYKKMPNLAIYSNDGGYYNLPVGSTHLHSQNNYRNPVALASLATNNLKTYNVQPTLQLRYDLLDPDANNGKLEYKAIVSFQMRNEKTHKYHPKEVSSRSWDSDMINRASNVDNENVTIQTDNNIMWQPNLGENHSGFVSAAFQTSSGNTNSQTVVSYGYPSSDITNPTAPAYLVRVGSSIGQFRSLGAIGRIHYSFQEKYIASFVLRRDGSTKFGKDNKYGNFPGLNLRWNISKEPFMDFAKDWLDMLSVRPSWGITGNQPTNEYLHFSRYRASGNYAGHPVIYPENIRLANLKWEKKTGWNLGFDLQMMDYKYNLDVNLYREITTDLLSKDAKIPTSTGFSTLPYRNAGSLENTGWEVNFSASQFVKWGNVGFDFRFNIAQDINTLTKLEQDLLDTHNVDPEYRNMAPYLQRLEVGKSYGSIFGYRYKGVYQWSLDRYQNEQREGTAPVARDEHGNPLRDSRGDMIPIYYNYYQMNNATRYQFQAGDAIYEDINNDGTIDELDIVYLGNSNPLLNGGIGFGFRWKQLSANVFANFRYGNKIINRARMNAESMYTFDNQSIAANWRWRVEDGSNDSRLLPRALYNYGYNSLPSDRYVEDGSFIRLKVVQLNYAVPPANLKQYGLKQLTFYLTANNLLCLTKYQGVDPEVSYSGLGISQDNAITPRSKDVTVGITIGF